MTVLRFYFGQFFLVTLPGTWYIINIAMRHDPRLLVELAFAVFCAVCVLWVIASASSKIRQQTHSRDEHISCAEFFF